MQDYRRLRVWKKAHALTLNVRRATRQFPLTGYASLRTQLTGSAESVPYNIVEGCGATSQKEFARFLGISVKSTFELEYQLRLAKDYEVLDYKEWQALTSEGTHVRRMLCGLRSKVLESESGINSKKDPPIDPSESISHGKTENGNTVN